jgi:hypothetical protein
MKKSLQILVPAALILGFGQVHSQTVLIDLGNVSSFRGASVSSPDSNGNFWTSVWSGAFYSNLPDSTGAATTIDFGFGSVTGTDSFNGPAGDTTVNGPADSVYDAGALGAFGVDEVVFDYYVSSTFQIQGLDPTKTYDLSFFGSHKFNADDTTVYTVYTDNTYTVPVASTSLLVGTGSAHNQDTLATISGLSPQTGNILYVGFEGSTGGSGYLNALSVTAVPEPGTFALMMGIGALGLIYVRRRLSR